ncbi:MAG: Glycoside hydrolase family 48 [Candidatus Roizmanbacteria bacterium GW2011_GWA2_37_7]|uniref:Glycoside hydrolase family 48 n=1 Tax=Candidatus Roizmanbacteria bacterium GW2011_GWA2_37_7 TaxID=1618481 RepID=A0A0G0H8Y7_9BACT|nr:MAG: Glycoside hydrolase family 48 [Candidatus Roizmanbacteria bacterium GW2011_GWA2_37_7]
MQSLYKIICSFILFSLIIFSLNVQIYAQTDAPTATPTETPTPTSTSSPTPTESPTHIPTTIETPTPSPTPEHLVTYGPPIPNRPQQKQQGQVKSAFSDESGPGNIFDSKLGEGTSGVIKVMVSVIALTLTGIVGWFAMKSNTRIEVEEGSETITQDETNLPNE